MTRRKALRLLAGIGALAAIPGPHVRAAKRRPRSLARFESSLDLRTVARLGRDYLASTPEEAHAAGLLARLAGTAGEAIAPDVLARTVGQDFAAGRVVELYDWQVSVTEARIFALIALTAAP